MRERIGMDLYHELRMRKMIIVEDDTLLKDSLSLFFRSKGCEVSAFENAENALEAMETERFGVVIADQWLPGMDGVSLLNRAWEMESDAIRILITGIPNPGILDEANRSGVDDFILKPFTPDEIEASLWRLIRRRNTKAADAP